MTLKSAIPLLLLQAALFAGKGAANCECGYSVNATSDANYQVFTEAWETDFLHLSTMDWATGWMPQIYSVSPEVARGPYGKQAQLGNVVLNPLKDVNAWSGDSVHGGQAGLQLIVRSALNGTMVPMAELDSIRTDMLYGSFRVGVKYSGISGTCGAFFWYRNNSQEIDMELLSREFTADNSTANLVVQTPKSAAQGFNAFGTPDFAQPSLPFDPSAEFHEYRFDWWPGQVNFYVDGQLLDVMTDTIPDAPGKVVFNHWSNGDKTWSAGPPMQDAVMTILYSKMYFNASLTHPTYRKLCPTYDAGKVCQIPEQSTPPALSNSPPTNFFSTSSNNTQGQISSNTTWGSNGQHNAASSSFSHSSALVIAAATFSSLWLVSSSLL